MRMPDTLLQLSLDGHTCVVPRCHRNQGTSGYSRAMDQWLLFVLVFGSGGAALAQGADPVQPHRNSATETTRAQKRVELRTILSVDRSHVQQAASAAEPAPAGRQLNAEERAEMREQLRRFQPDSSQLQQP